MPQLYLKQLLEEGQTVNPVFSFLGIIIDHLSKEKVVLRLPFKQGFVQGGGVIAGGIMATLADEAMGHVVIANLGAGQHTATIEMNMRYLKAVARGEITAECFLVKKGRRVLTVHADVYDEKHELLAQAGASFMVIEKK